MDRRFAEEATHAEAERLRMVTYTLLGLRYPPAVVDQLMPGLQAMRDSSTYQAILDEGRVEGRVEGRAEGRVEGERRLLLLVGEGRFGPPDDVTQTRLGAIEDADAIERLARRLLTVSSWAELLSTQP
jgi:predicted transposase YdaD